MEIKSENIQKKIIVLNLLPVLCPFISGFIPKQILTFALMMCFFGMLYLVLKYEDYLAASFIRFTLACSIAGFSVSFFIFLTSIGA